MNKKGIAPLLVIGIIFLVVAGSMGALQVGSFFGSGNVFAKPDWARLECELSDTFEKKVVDTLDDKTLWKCDGFTDECRFKIRNTNPGGFFSPSVKGQYRVCDLNGNNCGGPRDFFISPATTQNIDNIPVGKSYKFTPKPLSQASSNTNAEDIEVTQDWRVGKLFRFVGGSKTTINSQSCQVPTSEKDRIRESDEVVSLSLAGGEGQKWVNYVNDWNFGPATNVFSHPSHGQVYCTAGQIFEIVELEMSNGDLVKLDPSYSGTTESGDSINGLGSKISNVACCPNEPSCNDNFEFTSLSDDSGPSQCFSDVQCFNAGGPVPVDGFHYVTYSCESGSCVQSDPIQVDCTTNSQCSGNQICDLSTTNYGKCVTQATGPFCGDDICQTDETFALCPNDCALQCPPGQKLVTEYSSEGMLCFFGKGLCNEVKSQYCSEGERFDFLNILTIILIVVGGFIALRFLWPFIKSVTMSIKGMLPI